MAKSILEELKNEYKRIVRRIAKRAGVIAPYDFYDFKTKKASKAEIEHDRQEYIRLNKDSRFNLESKNEVIVDFLKYINSEHGINYIPTYVRDLWGARKVYQNKPNTHYDCGSSFQGFVTLLIPMGIDIKLIDIRDLKDRFNTALFAKNDIRGGGG
ncbi:hypothetical protein DCO58_05020 [Helicobacter saguini]|uniref:Uncharacterized protein n=2 Tax=Helicobacter saguini TaxID=1548018 RepID=A0A4U8T640_9HELI|nr:hypothetical protein [Helicobacter saguini]MWV62289.1 hypothetical protein [Helicobacter saguini]MWV67038.1 hypothetical protein [Helicobacter saguini]MWV69387.1 hypothetical protein [Helicobacter saguini]TLD95039.1 hypothetical protein LS64_003780 [Helicobacter saguini]